MRPPTVFVVAGVWDVWAFEAGQSPWRETGGILIGYWTSAGDSVVTHATGPGPRARRTLRAVEIDGDHCQRELDAIYWGSGGALTFLGDWHTHPFGSLHPSQQDQSTLSGIATNLSYRAAHPLLVIYGPTWPVAVPRLQSWLPKAQVAAYMLTDENGLVAIDVETIPAVPDW